MLVLRTLLIATVLAWAAGDARAQPLTMEDAVELASARSPDLRVAQARLEISAARRMTAGSWFPANPRIELGVRTDSVFQGRGDGSFEVRLEQELEVFGQRGRRVELINAERAGLRLELSAVGLRVRADVIAAYVDLVFHEQRVAALDVAVAQAARLDEAAERRISVGDISDAERSLVHADLVSTRVDARSVAGERTAARVRLNVLVGLPPGTAISTTGELPAGPPPAPLDELLRAARARRPDLSAVAQAVTAADREIDLRRRERLPSPTIAISYARDRTVFAGDDVEPAGAITRLSDASSTFGVSIAFSLPVFRTGRGEIAEAHARRAEAEAQLDGLAASIDTTVAATRARYDEARQRSLDLAGVELELATTLELYERAYTGGKLDLVDFLAVRDRVLRAQVAALTARHDAAIARGELELAIGGTLEPTP